MCVQIKHGASDKYKKSNLYLIAKLTHRVSFYTWISVCIMFINISVAHLLDRKN